MNMNRLVVSLALAGAVILTSQVMALEPVLNLSRAARLKSGPLPPGDHSGPPTISDACPATNVGVLSDGSTIVGSTIGSSDDFAAGCGSNVGGQDEIFEFSLDAIGEWVFDSCTVPACWDTTLEIREETGGGCPGDFVACDGDGCNVCYYESAVTAFLVTSSTYYLIVDGWSSFVYGDFTITATLAVPGCASDADCDDGTVCNGAETCNTATGQCSGGPNPCVTFEGYTAPCDETLDLCPPIGDVCTTWIGGGQGTFFIPSGNICLDTATWVFDDVQMSHHTTGVLEHYTTPVIARSTPAGASPVGTAFLVNQALFEVMPGTCNPAGQIAGSQCTVAGTVNPLGAPTDSLQPCSGTMPLLPNNSGDFNRCEIDFFLAQRTTENGAGMSIAGEPNLLGGPAAADEFGITVNWIEDCPPTGAYSPVVWGCPGCVQDFENAVVCAKPGGSCCHPDGSCSLTSEADCDGDYGFTGTASGGTDGGCGGDPDDDGKDNRCGDNCPDTSNPGQEDCDGDGEGDACEADAGDQDGDGDGHCNRIDLCPNDSGENGDRDGDGVGDICDPCPDSNPDDADGDGVCGDVDTCEGHDDNADADGDGVPDGCDECPGSDDGAAGALGDDDGDGVLNCLDRCNGVDDAVFAPECSGKIPAVSEWGIVIMALLLLAGAKVYFGRRETPV